MSFRFCIVRQDGFSASIERWREASESLPELLDSGWVPVRETPMGTGSCLVLLENTTEFKHKATRGQHE